MDFIIAKDRDINDQVQFRSDSMINHIEFQEGKNEHISVYQTGSRF